MSRPMCFRISIAALVCITIGGSIDRAARADEPSALELAARRRAADTEESVPQQQTLKWDAKKTAVLICDMWDQHWCKGASARVAEMAPAMNRVVHLARQRGALIVHAPSSTLDFYEDTPQRRRAREAPPADSVPEGIDKWCSLIESKEGKLPIDDSDGGCDCEPRCEGGSPWRRQIATIDIESPDAITDSGRETWNLFAQRGIENVILMGVHTNMCVMGRSFGLRNMVRNGKNVVLMRDLTDTMYNSRMKPYVSHFRGTDLVVEHIEQHWAPTITSTSFTNQPPFRFRDDVRPEIVFAIAEREYETRETLPVFAKRVLEDRYGMRTTVLHVDPDDANSIPGLETLHADLLVISVRRRALRPAQMEAVRKHLDTGKPLVAIRTASHAFHTRGKTPEGYADWPEFDPQVLGGNYHGHHGNQYKPMITAVAAAEDHPLLNGVSPLPFESQGSLYKASPLADGATPLLVGRIPNEKAEPVAWTYSYRGGRVFYTSLGHRRDFEQAPFERLMTNAVFWALGKDMPKSE